jgi:hypothetical protein
MMSRRQQVFCLAICLAGTFVRGTGPAMAQESSAQNSGPGHQLAPFEAPTVAVFLASCDRDISQCEFTLRLALLDKLNTRDATSICEKEAHSEKPVIAWLKAHPETHAMATEDGIYAAYKSLYPCP